MSKPRTPMEMVEILQSRVTAGARSYRMATVRYLMRPPLSLRPKYAAFLLDLAYQSDHVQEVLGRAAERATNDDIAALLRHHDGRAVGERDHPEPHLRDLGSGAADVSLCWAGGRLVTAAARRSEHGGADPRGAPLEETTTAKRCLRSDF